MVYDLYLTDLPGNAVEVAAKDEQALDVIRDATRLHGYTVGVIEDKATGFCFRAQSDEPGKVREFLMSLSDVQNEWLDSRRDGRTDSSAQTAWIGGRWSAVGDRGGWPS
ncbi:MAG TPA: hypothetical protein VG125_30050 [Pirellulales bacterium]|jgi:hypothetical protein|nr:hypothetical protein [Pirellulales bacterium]